MPPVKPPRRPRYRPRKHHAWWLAALLAVAAAIGYHLASPSKTPPPPAPQPLSTSQNLQKNLPVITEYPAEPTPPAPTPTPAKPPAPPPPPPRLDPAAPTASLAIVIDDMGQDVPHTRQAMQILPPEVTFAFLPYPPQSPSLATQARKNGHDILVHIPCEPLGHGTAGTPDPGPNALLAADDTATLVHKIALNLAPLKKVAVGANNHMGSAFTQSLAGMQTLLAELDRQGYFFLDSLTINPTATRKAAAGLALPVLTRSTFLDHTPTVPAVRRQLYAAMQHAQQHGSAIAIGHPHPSTLQVLAEELPTLPANIRLVPVTALLP